MNKKCICCTLIMSLLMGIYNASFAEEKAKLQSSIIKLLEAQWIDEISEDGTLTRCNGEKKESYNKTLKLRKMRIRLIHWYNVSQKLTAKVQIPNLRNSKWFRVIIEYFAELGLASV